MTCLSQIVFGSEHITEMQSKKKLIKKCLICKQQYTKAQCGSLAEQDKKHISHTHNTDMQVVFSNIINTVKDPKSWVFHKICLKKPVNMKKNKKEITLFCKSIKRKCQAIQVFSCVNGHKDPDTNTINIQENLCFQSWPYWPNNGLYYTEACVWCQIRYVDSDCFHT